MNSLSRRRFVSQTFVASAGVLAGPICWSAARNQRTRLPVAGVATVYRRGSHAHVILGKILEGFDQLGGTGPDLELVSLYIDQLPQNDMSRELAKKFGFRLCKTIDEAINLGGNEVGVEGVLSIGEHGDYPRDSVTNQRKYPRKRFFDGIVKAFQRGGRVVPVFNDKHLSYRSEDVLAMLRTAQDLKIPFMAGSSLPVAWRVPALQLPMGCELEEAIGIGYGPEEGYGFHTLEMLQCMVERRRGGETGVAAVRAIHGRDILEAERQGYFSRGVLKAAVTAQTPDDLEKNVPDDLMDRVVGGRNPFYLIDFRDGFRCCVVMLNGFARKFSFGCRLKSRPEPMATMFALQDGPPYQHFSWLLRAIEQMVHTREPSYPVERTVLTSGVIDAAMHSLAQQGRRIETPQLDISYRPADWSYAPGEPPPFRMW